MVTIEDRDGLAFGRVDFGGVVRSVCLSYVDAEPGDWVLVHVGFALSRLEPEEARENLRLLEELCLLDEPLDGATEAAGGASEGAPR